MFYVSLPTAPIAKYADKHFFSIDNELMYWNFFLDFGPFNLGMIYRFFNKLNEKLNSPKRKDQKIYYFSSTNLLAKTNAVFLICAWQNMFLRNTVDEAYAPFRSVSLSIYLPHLFTFFLQGNVVHALA